MHGNSSFQRKRSWRHLADKIGEHNLEKSLKFVKSRKYNDVVQQSSIARSVLLERLYARWYFYSDRSNKEYQIRI